jgi:phage repressor protein C with HTH and peptisase S24 domain
MASFTHDQIWIAIDRLARKYGFSASGLAKASGLDPTTFNKSKRANEGKMRWPSTESVARALSVTGASFEEFVSLATGTHLTMSRRVPVIGFAQAGASGYFDDAGFPAGVGWDEILFPGLADEHAYALEISGDSMQPAFRDGDRVVVSPQAGVRRGDRVVVKTVAGEVMAKQLARHTAQRIELRSFNPAYDIRSFMPSEISFMHRIVWASQ